MVERTLRLVEGLHSVTRA